MKIFAASLVVLLAATLAVAQQAQPAPPDWAQRQFDAPADKVFAAALKSIEEQKHEIKKKDEAAHTIEFHVGTTAWSWGYNMILTITPVDKDHSKVVTGIKKSGGDVFSWGSGKKEVGKIYKGMDAALAGKPNPESKTKSGS
jgi:hypothetical protein